MSQTPRVVRNDWSTLAVPRLGAWRPRLPVSVVIPAYDCQDSLDLTVASLSVQTYPAGLLEVLIVDDGSDPPLRLPPIRPDNTRIIRTSEHASGWGIGNAVRLGVRHTSGDVILRLDADVPADPRHVEAHARWHHEIPYAATLGYKRFVDIAPGDAGWPAPAEVVAAARAGSFESLFDLAASQPHDYVERTINRTDRLRSADHLAFMVHVGATAAVRRELYEAAGGVDANLRVGEDTEFGYRLAQAGAVFIPEPDARGWHLGRTGMMRATAQLQRYTRAFLADLMPYPRWLRRTGGTAWAVPLVLVVMRVDGHPVERVRAAVDAVLNNHERDLRICLVGAWHGLGEPSRPVLADPMLDLRLIAATYRSEPRVEFADHAPPTAFPSPFLLDLPATCGLSRSTVGRLVDQADRRRAGAVVVRPDGGEALTLWRTSAVGRARWVARDGEPLADAVAATYGSLDVTADAAGVVDLSRFRVDDLAGGVGAQVPGPSRRSSRWMPATVEVAGMRSLARATVLVGRLSAARAGAGTRRLAARARRFGKERRGSSA